MNRKIKYKIKTNFIDLIHLTLALTKNLYLRKFIFTKIYIIISMKCFEIYLLKFYLNILYALTSSINF